MFLAPIHEYTNYPFRELCKKYNAKYSLVPLVSSMGIVSNEKYVEKIDYFNEENTGIQLFGSKPEIMGKASEIIIKKFHNLKWIDINSGCPSRNVIQSGGGSALLKHPKIVKEIVKEIKSRDVKVSVKMRLCNTDEKTFNFIKEIEPDFLIVHGRTVEQMYSGEADWGKIKEIKKKCNFPIIGNGDLENQIEGKEKIKDKYCDGVMMGRKAMSNPGCFSNFEIKKENKIKFLREYIEILKEKEYYEKITLTKVKALNILKGFQESSNVRKKISTVKNIKEIEKILETESDFGCY
jgi:tRNA-dihydrouridine synthase B